ncbi:hypothetical protein JKP88DRAFT_278987 [Tribonema minus]|uniref:Uncharacterized protein n=1 Tax=Tribonema minus TaxID=303371 RepID=A0A835YW22_9STRA|nr:hypothetical protein JKP88DRAFT_278987 [Tribonema minus]
MRFVVKDTFKVKIGNEEKFEEFWRERKLSLEGQSGFSSFMLVRGEDDFDETQEGGRLARDGFATFETTTVWLHRMDFDDWRSKKDSPDKKRGFLAMSAEDVAAMLLAPPEQRLYETVVTLPKAAEENVRLGGLFDWEENPDYFDGDLY